MTVLPTIFACGNVGKLTFVAQRAPLAYCVTVVGEKEQLECIADCFRLIPTSLPARSLPRLTLLSSRDEQSHLWGTDGQRSQGDIDT